MEYEVIGDVVEFYVNGEFKRLVIMESNPEKTISDYLKNNS